MSGERGEMRVRYCREKVLRDLGAFCTDISATLLVRLALLGHSVATIGR